MRLATTPAAYFIRIELGQGSVRQRVLGLPANASGTELELVVTAVTGDEASVEIAGRNLTRTTITLDPGDFSVLSVADNRSGEAGTVSWAEGGTLLQPPAPFRLVLLYPLTSAVRLTVQFTLPLPYGPMFSVSVAGVTSSEITLIDRPD